MWDAIGFFLISNFRILCRIRTKNKNKAFVPGNAGTVGLPPQAINMCVPLYTFSRTLMFPSGVKTAWPGIYSTLSYVLHN